MTDRERQEEVAIQDAMEAQVFQAGMQNTMSGGVGAFPIEDPTIRYVGGTDPIDVSSVGRITQADYMPVQPTMSAATLTTLERDELIAALQQTGMGVVDAGLDPNVRRRTVFSYDISALPARLDLDRMMEIYRETGCILYDSWDESRGRTAAPPTLTVVPLDTSIRRSKEER